MNEQFFEDETVQSVVETHKNRILRLEDSEAEKVIQLYRKIRRELRDRLDLTAQGTFTAEKIRGALIQVETAIDAMNKSLLTGFLDSFDLAALRGIDDLVAEINKFNKRFIGAVIPINVDAAVIASETKNFLLNRYEASINAYSEQVRSMLTQGITEAAIQQKSYSEVVQSLGRWFQGEEWKLHRIARTELHNVYSQGKLRTMERLWDEGEGSIPDLKKTLFHVMDKRTGEDSKILAKNNPIVPIDEPFVENSTGKELVYMHPPNRPNDRAIMIPYRDSWR